MTQDGRWKLKYNEVMSFMEKEYRKLSKYYPKEKLMFHFIHHNRKLYNVGTMKEERKVLFPDFVTFLRHVCKCLIIKGRSRRFG